jgi:putative ABC transport system permease protein
MIRHLFKLIWNRRKSNFLLMTEIFFSFLVLFGVLSLVVYNYRNYQKPLGFEHENVWLLSFRPHSDSSAQNRLIQEQVLQRIKGFQEVESVALTSGNVPFAFSQMMNGLAYNNGETVTANTYHAQDALQEVLRLQVRQGRWFGPQDDASRHRPIVINNMLKEKLFGEEDALGKQLPINDSTHHLVIGVVDYYRAGGEFEADAPAYFTRINLQGPADTEVWGSLLLRVKPGTGVAFEEKMVKELSLIAQGWTLEVSTLEKMQAKKAKVSLIPMIALGVVCGFLIFNVALGLFGVLWYNINRRTGEIGLRRAIGADAGQIYRQFIGEVLVLATLGVLLGLVLTVQFPLLHVFQVESGVYLTAVVCAGVIIYVLAAICAFYPSRQAAGIEPAVALHEE